MRDMIQCSWPRVSSREEIKPVGYVLRLNQARNFTQLKTRGSFTVRVGKNRAVLAEQERLVAATLDPPAMGSTAAAADDRCRPNRCCLFLKIPSARVRGGVSTLRPGFFPHSQGCCLFLKIRVLSAEVRLSSVSQDAEMSVVDCISRFGGAGQPAPADRQAGQAGSAGDYPRALKMLASALCAEQWLQPPAAPAEVALIFFFECAPAAVAASP